MRSRVSSRTVLVGAAVVAAAGLALSRPDSSPFAPGAVLLLAAALLVALVRRPWAQLVALVVFTLVLVVRLGDGLGADLAGGRGTGVAVGSWGFVLGFAVGGAVGVSEARSFRRPERRLGRGRRPRPAHLGLAVGLLLLSAVCAEDLAAYDNTTGRPGELLAGAVVFGFLYGRPALLIREFVRQTGRGWPAILLLATAAGLVQAGLVDQSMFNDSYREIEIWDELWRPTSVAGLSVFATQSFVVGHIVYSYCAPVALTEAIRPAAAGRAWVGRWTLSIVAILYLGVAGLVLGDTLRNEPAPSVPQLVGTAAVVAALVVAAVKWRKPTASGAVQRSAPHIRLVVVTSFGAATALAVAPSTWAGVALSGAVLALAGTLLVRASRRAGWGLRLVVAVAAGAVLARAVLAFFYYPVIGDVSAARKYAHNVVMLLLVGAVIAIAAARTRRARVPAAAG